MSAPSEPPRRNPRRLAIVGAPAEDSTRAPTSPADARAFDLVLAPLDAARAEGFLSAFVAGAVAAGRAVDVAFDADPGETLRGALCAMGAVRCHVGAAPADGATGALRVSVTASPPAEPRARAVIVVAESYGAVLTPRSARLRSLADAIVTDARPRLAELLAARLARPLRRV